jgi:hypothetical protein
MTDETHSTDEALTYTVGLLNAEFTAVAGRSLWEQEVSARLYEIERRILLIEEPLATIPILDMDQLGSK